MSYDPNFDAPTFKVEPPQKKPHGCFFWGCITLVILFVLAALAAGIGGYALLRFFVNTAKEYSDTEPVPMPPVVMPEKEREELRQRVNTYAKALDDRTASEPLILTAEDINALLDDNPNFRGRASVTIEGDKIKAKVSLPLDALAKIPGFKELSGRYLNGTATLRVSLRDDELDVRASDIIVKGKPLPAQFADSFSRENLAKEQMKDPKFRASIRKFESIEVKDGKVIVTPRPENKGTPKENPEHDAAGDKKEAPKDDGARPDETPKAKADAPKEEEKPRPNPETAEALLFR